MHALLLISRDQRYEHECAIFWRDCWGEWSARTAGNWRRKRGRAVRKACNVCSMRRTGMKKPCETNCEAMCWRTWQTSRVCWLLMRLVLSKKAKSQQELPGNTVELLGVGRTVRL